MLLCLLLRTLTTSTASCRWHSCGGPTCSCTRCCACASTEARSAASACACISVSLAPSAACTRCSAAASPAARAAASSACSGSVWWRLSVSTAVTGCTPQVAAQREYSGDWMHTPG